MRPQLNPSFAVSRGAKVFTIGSCFARNIEEHVANLGCHVPMLEFSAPENESRRERGNGILNKYTPASIQQELEWAEAILVRDGIVREADCAGFRLDLKDERCVDLMLASYEPVTRSRFLERRQEVFDTFRNAFDAPCVTITLGLTEAWFDTVSSRYIQAAPMDRLLLPFEDRFEFEVLSYEKCLAFTQSSIDLIRRHNGAANFLITTSPVPLLRTFTESDIITANMASKSTLRAVCAAIERDNPGVDYFPSYECVTLSARERVWEKDGRHVSQGYVGEIVGAMTDAYFPNADGPDRDFQQARAAFELKQFDVAEERVRAALLARPDEASYLELYGYALEARHQPKKAIAPLERAAELGETPKMRIGLSRIQRSLGNSEEALAQAEHALRLAPNRSGPHAALGAALFDLRRLDEAKSSFERALELGPRQRQARSLLVTVLAEQGDFERARKIAETGLRGDPGHVHVRVLLARVFTELGQKDAAIEQLRVALELAPTHRGAEALLAQLDE